MASFLQIGPLRWELDVDVSYSDPAYDGFCFDRANEPLVTIPVSVRLQSRKLPAGEPLYQGGKNWALWEDGRYLIICSGFFDQSVPRFYCRLDRDGSSADVFLDPAREDGSNPLRYPIDQILSWGPLAKCGGLILHSAVAVRDGIGWVFSGRSGAGKSTLAEQCHRAGWQILNDDRVMVFKRGGQWRVSGTPWHGSGRFAEAEEVPLGGVLFIEKSERDLAVRMDPEQVRYSLLDVAAVPWFEDSWSQAALNVADSFAREVSFFRFECTKTRSAVDAVEACTQEELSV